MATKPNNPGNSSKTATGASATTWKGMYCGEALRSTGSPYKVDSGAHYLPRPGFETDIKSIGEWSYFIGKADENFLETQGLVGNSGSRGYLPVPKSNLAGMSIALLFSAFNDPKCSIFMPFLKQFYKNVNESGERPKIEIIFVSMDETEKEFELYRKSMPWLCADYSSPLRQELISKYNIMDHLPNRKDGRFLGGNIPRLVVVGPLGEPIYWLPCDHQSPNVLREWDIFGAKWPDLRKKVDQDVKLKYEGPEVCMQKEDKLLNLERAWGAVNKL